MDDGEEIDLHKLNEACEAQAEFEKYKAIEDRDPHATISGDPVKRETARRNFDLMLKSQGKRYRKAIEASPRLRAADERAERDSEAILEIIKKHNFKTSQEEIDVGERSASSDKQAVEKADAFLKSRCHPPIG